MSACCGWSGSSLFSTHGIWDIRVLSSLHAHCFCARWNHGPSFSDILPIGWGNQCSGRMGSRGHVIKHVCKDFGPQTWASPAQHSVSVEDTSIARVVSSGEYLLRWVFLFQVSKTALSSLNSAFNVTRTFSGELAIKWHFINWHLNFE